MIQLLFLGFWGPALYGDTSNDDKQHWKPAPLACALLCQYHCVGCTVLCLREWNWVKRSPFLMVVWKCHQFAASPSSPQCQCNTCRQDAAPSGWDGSCIEGVPAASAPFAKEANVLSSCFLVNGIACIDSCHCVVFQCWSINPGRQS